MSSGLKDIWSFVVGVRRMVFLIEGMVLVEVEIWEKVKYIWGILCRLIEDLCMGRRGWENLEINLKVFMR